MKRIAILPICMAMLMLAPSCTKSDSVAPPQSVSASSDEDAALALTQPAPGNYSVTKFVDDGVRKTNTLAGYVFIFASNGTLTANQGTQNYVGTWEIESDGEMEIDFDSSAPNAVREIRGGWDVDRITQRKIVLTDIENDGTGSDFLTFTRIP